MLTNSEIWINAYSITASSICQYFIVKLCFMKRFPMSNNLWIWSYSQWRSLVKKVIFWWWWWVSFVLFYIHYSTVLLCVIFAVTVKSIKLLYKLFNVSFHMMLEYNFLCMHIMIRRDKRKRRTLQRTE